MAHALSPAVFIQYVAKRYQGYGLNWRPFQQLSTLPVESLNISSDIASTRVHGLGRRRFVYILELQFTNVLETA